jgi:hypothetical protein
VSRTLLSVIAVVTATAFAFLCIAWGGVAYWLWPTVKRIDTTSHLLLDCTYYDQVAKITRGNGGCLVARIDGITGSVNRATGAIAKAMPEITTAAKKASNNSATASEEAAGAAKESKLLVQDIRKLVNEDLHGALVDMRTDLQDVHSLIAGKDNSLQALLGSSNESVVALKGVFDNFVKVEQQAEAMLEEDRPKAAAMFDAALKLLNDPAIPRTLDNIDRGTASLSNTMDTIDKITAPLRKKVNQLKWVLTKILQITKIVFDPTQW